MEPIAGYYDDDGNKINPDLVKKPGLCLICKMNELDDPIENLLCTMTRHDQRNKEEFVCGAFEEKVN